MNESYEPVFLSNESIPAKRHKVGEVIKMRVAEVMDDGVKVVCSHAGSKQTPPSDGRKEMAENASTRYREAMAGNAPVEG